MFGMLGGLAGKLANVGGGQNSPYTPPKDLTQTDANAQQGGMPSMGYPDMGPGNSFAGAGKSNPFMGGLFQQLMQRMRGGVPQMPGPSNPMQPTPFAGRMPQMGMQKPMPMPGAAMGQMIPNQPQVPTDTFQPQMKSQADPNAFQDFLRQMQSGNMQRAGNPNPNMPQ